MSGAMRKMGVYLGLLEDADGDYADPGTDYDQTAAVTRPPETTRAAAVADLSERRRKPVSAPSAPMTAAEPMSRIVTLHPRTYNDARVIGENFRDGVPVIMNLSEMAESDAKRLVDFAAGLIFSVRGSIERVTSKVFLLTPPDVSVGSEEKQRLAEGGFFNQS